MAIQKLNTARGVRHIQIKDDGKTVFISKDRYDELRRDGETVKRARSTDNASSGSKSSSGGKSSSTRRKSSSGGKSSSTRRKSSSGSKSSSTRRESDDGFFASLLSNLK